MFYGFVNGTKTTQPHKAVMLEQLRLTSLVSYFSFPYLPSFQILLSKLFFFLDRLFRKLKAAEYFLFNICYNIF